MLFDGPPAELPIATLRPSVHARRRLVVDLTYGWARCAAWLRPRAVPLLVAFASLFAMLGAVKAMAMWTERREPLGLSMHVYMYEDPLPADSWCGHRDCRELATGPCTILLRPITPDAPYVELQITGPHAR